MIIALIVIGVLYLVIDEIMDSKFHNQYIGLLESVRVNEDNNRSVNEYIRKLSK